MFQKYHNYHLKIVCTESTSITNNSSFLNNRVEWIKSIKFTLTLSLHRTYGSVYGATFVLNSQIFTVAAFLSICKFIWNHPNSFRHQRLRFSILGYPLIRTIQTLRIVEDTIQTLDPSHPFPLQKLLRYYGLSWLLAANLVSTDGTISVLKRLGFIVRKTTRSKITHL